MTPGDELSLDGAREVLEAWVRRTWWRRRGLARALTIDAFQRSGARHVIFESFTEERSTGWTHAPYRGGPVDGPEQGPAPGPWDMVVPRPTLFESTRQVFDVPHTSTVKLCHVCNGSGSVTCGSCGGSGSVTCGSCGGSGSVSRTRTVTSTDANGNSTTTTEMYNESCSCFSGRVTCSTCGGGGSVTCGTCSGARHLRHYVALTVVWTDHVAEKVLEHTDLPDELLRGAQGVTALHEEDDRVEPTHGSAGQGPFRGGAVRLDAEVDATADALIQSHAFPPGVKLHRQRLQVRALPVYEARYRWGRELRRFWVYGTDRRVHAPRFPLSTLRIGSLVGVFALSAAGVAALVYFNTSPEPPMSPDSNKWPAADASPYNPSSP